MKRWKQSSIWLIPFLAVSITLYIIMLRGDITGNYRTANIKYSLIAICFFFISIKPELKFNSWLFRFALLFTLISDYFLLFKDNYMPGLITFAIVQTLYFIYLSLSLKKWTLRITMRMSLILLVSILISSIMKQQFWLIFILGYYFINLVFNTIEAFILIKKDRMMIILAVGFLLFVGCDICVALNNLKSFTRLPEFLIEYMTVINILMWVFYAPSQILIATYGLIPTKEL